MNKVSEADNWLRTSSEKGICGLYIHRTRNVFEGIIRDLSGPAPVLAILFNAFKKIFRFQMKTCALRGQKSYTEKATKYVLHGDLGGLEPSTQ